MSAVSGYPRPAPATIVTLSHAIARDCRSPDISSRATAIASGTRDIPTPWSARAATSSAKLPSGTAAAARTVPSRTVVRPARIVGRRTRPDAKRPTTGVLTAPASRAAVRLHWAVVSRTSKCSTTLGTSGAPRLLVIAVMVVSRARVVRR